MSNEYPKLLYKEPGPHEVWRYKQDHIEVADSDAEAAALADGWHASPDAAHEAHVASKLDGYGSVGNVAADPSNPVVIDPLAEDTPPTRAELEQKAAKLGLKYDGRIGDKKLSALIAEKLAEG